MEHSESGYFLQQVYSSLTHDFEMQPNQTTTSCTFPFVNMGDIDRMVELEMQRIKENCTQKENQYVEQMLAENPITIERRANTNNITAATVKPSTSAQTATMNPANISMVQQQRAEACRRSRINNKVKKAKSKYRHKYMSQRLLQSSQMFNCIQELIAKAESHLLAQGMSREKLHRLRHTYGVDQASAAAIQHLQQIKMETEFN